MSKVVPVVFNEENHEYLFEDKKIKYSTTKVLGEFFPFGGGLEVYGYWLSKLGRKGNQQAKEYADVVKEIIPFLKNEKETEAHNGTLAHKAIESLLKQKGGKDISLFDTEFYKEYSNNPFAQEYSNGISNELSNLLPFNVLTMETPLYDTQLEVAGMFDAAIEKDGDIYLLDFKTGSKVEYDKYDKVVLQLSHYKRMFENHFNKKVNKMFCIYSAETEKQYTTKKRFDAMTPKEQIAYIPVEVAFMKDLPKEKTGVFFLESKTLDLTYALEKGEELFVRIVNNLKEKATITKELKELIKNEM